MSAGELTSFLSCNVPSSLDAAHNDELSLLKGVETVRVRLPGRGERERDAKSSYSGEVRNSFFSFELCIQHYLSFFSAQGRFVNTQYK